MMRRDSVWALKELGTIITEDSGKTVANIGRNDRENGAAKVQSGTEKADCAISELQNCSKISEKVQKATGAF